MFRRVTDLVHPEQRAYRNPDGSTIAYQPQGRAMAVPLEDPHPLSHDEVAAVVDLVRARTGLALHPDELQQVSTQVPVALTRVLDRARTDGLETPRGTPPTNPSDERLQRSFDAILDAAEVDRAPGAVVARLESDSLAAGDTARRFLAKVYAEGFDDDHGMRVYWHGNDARLIHGLMNRPATGEAVRLHFVDGAGEIHTLHLTAPELVSLLDHGHALTDEHKSFTLSPDGALRVHLPFGEVVVPQAAESLAALRSMPDA